MAEYKGRIDVETANAAHPEYNWARGLTRDMPTGAWTEFSSGMKDR